MSRVFAVCALVLAALTASAPQARASAPVRNDYVSFADFGYDASIVLGGVHAGTFTIFLPVYAQLRKADLILPLRISPIADPDSSISVAVNGVPILTSSVRALGRSPRLVVPLTGSLGSSGQLEITVAAHLFVMRDHCQDDSNPGLWLTLAPQGGFALVTERRRAQTLAGWFHSYRNRVRIIVDRSASPSTRMAALALPYMVQRVAPWRTLSLELADRPDPATRTIIVGEFARSAEVRGDDLYLSRTGIALVQPSIAPFVLTPAVDTSDAGAPAVPKPVTSLTFAQLGLDRQTRSGGPHDIAFTIPFSFAQAGGEPQNLRLLLGMTHTALPQEQAGSADVEVNGVLVRSYQLNKTGSAETFEVPIDSSLIHAVNTVRVTTSFRDERSVFCIVPETFTVSLSEGSVFTWDGVRPASGGIGDFFHGAHGRLGVLLSSGAPYRAAFDLLAKLGAINDRIETISAAPFAGTVPDDVDEALVLAPPSDIAALSPRFVPNGRAFTMVDPTHHTRYSVSYREPFGVLETTRQGKIPTLLATYWSDPSTLAALAGFSPRLLAAQTDSLFVFAGSSVAYGTTDLRVAELHEPPNPLSLIAFAALSLGVVGIASVVFLGTRHSERTRKLAAPK